MIKLTKLNTLLSGKNERLTEDKFDDVKIINDYKKAIHQSERKDSKNNCPI
jgi:hypothetical protein